MSMVKKNSLRTEPKTEEATDRSHPKLPPAGMPHRLWDTKDVAMFLNVKESTIRHWVHIGYIPHIKFRGAVRFQEADIVSWLKEQTVSTQTRSPNRISRDILAGIRHRTS